MSSFLSPGGDVGDVSVILASYKAANTIESAIASVAKQRGVNVELLVVDGDSRDGTLEILNRLGSAVDWHVSEPDSGIYNAWNKALSRARGRFVCFLGADDRFARDDALATLVEAGEGGVDLVSCKAKYALPAGSGRPVTGVPWSWEVLKRGMAVEHRGLLHRRGLFLERGPFDESYAIAGDYDFLLRCGAELKAAHVDEVLVVLGHEGISQKRYVRRILERARAQLRHHALNPVHVCALAVHDIVRIAWHEWRRKLGHVASGG